MLELLAFGLPGAPELLVIFVIILLLFGAKRLPEIARSCGKALNEFKKGKDDFLNSYNSPPSRHLETDSKSMASNEAAESEKEIKNVTESKGDKKEEKPA